MNAQGLGDKQKRRDVLNFLKSKKYSICMLQDTHFTVAEENIIRSLWGYDCFFSNFNSQSRGVAIFINNTFDCKVNNIERDNNGNLLILKCNICDKDITLINIYGPNRDTPAFYQDLNDRMVKYENDLFILAGDFNLILNPDIDSFNYVNINNPNAREQLMNLMLSKNLIDCWRENHIENKEYTWFRRNPIKKARLDFFLISENLFTDVETSKILPGYRTDHSLIYVSFEFGKFKKGNSYWKFNNSLLKDMVYINEVKKVINNIKTQYATDIPNRYNRIEEVPMQDLTFSINDQLFFESLLLAIRGKSISYSSHKKKLDIDRENKLLIEIENIEKQTNINYDLLDSKRNTLLELRRKKMEGVLIRSRAKWIQEGEKPTNYYCNLENRNFVSKCMNTLTTQAGQHLHTQEEILSETKRHYQNLYKSNATEEVSLNELLSNMSVPKLSDQEQESIEGNLTYSEMLNSLKRMSNNTSPGNDGFTVEFIKFFWSDIGIFLVRSINYAFETGELSVTQKQGVITCIPKGNKDKSFLKNWRPISLLNVAYKIASSSIAFRIKNVLGNIINEDQTGFLPGRLMAMNIRLLYDILFYTEKHNMPGLLLLIDFAAAFDTVSWSFMYKVLEFFNFGPSIRKWVNLFYFNVESCVIINGHMSEWFSLQRGCRQGDALSPYLFILCAEILAVLLRNNQGIKGIKINGEEYIVSQYADDTSLTLDGTRDSLINTMSVLKFYGRISGLNINTEKTKVIWFGSRKNSHITICPEFNLSWENQNFTVLGIKFSTSLSEIVNLNYNSKIEEIKQLFANWSKRVISPLGKIVVIKTLALAKLNHLILGLPNPPQEKIDTIQNLFYKFLWNKSNDKIKRNIITQEYEHGGLKMIDLKTFMHSLKATWLRRLLKLEVNNKFNNVVESTCPTLKNIHKYSTDYIRNKMNQERNEFWKDVLYSYLILTKKISPKNDKQCYSLNLWYNPDIKVGGSSVCYKRWLVAGIVFLGDLINDQSEFYSYRDFNNTFNVRTNFIEYNGLLASIQHYLRRNNIDYLPEKTFNPHIPLPIALIIKDKKGCRSIYRQMLNAHESPKSLQKWKNDLAQLNNRNIDALINKPFYANVFKTTKDPKLLWLQYRINHRILGTNSLLKKMNINADDSCSFCENAPETVFHLFWACNVSAQFWIQLFNYIENKCNITMTEWNAYDVLFGSHNQDKCINNILLQAKHFLYINKMKKQLPSVELFKKNIVSYHRIEKYNSIKNLQLDKFEALWEKYKNLFSNV